MNTDECTTLFCCCYDNVIYNDIEKEAFYCCVLQEKKTNKKQSR